MINIGSYVNDEPWKYVNGDEIHNSNNSYRGWITIRDAIAYSVNVAAVKTLTDLTVERGFQSLLSFGFTSLDPARDSYQPLALGGISKGVSNLELTAAYAAIANEGNYIKPIFYTKILDQNDKVIIDNVPDPKRVISEDTAAILTSALTDVVKRGTATEVQLENGMPVAGKTGTTTAYNDIWFIGYTPYYTLGIWAGYDNNEKLPEEGIYRSYHKILWKKIMDRLSADEFVTDFRLPDSVSIQKTCGLSGDIPTAYCEHVSEDLVRATEMPVERCNLCSGGREDPVWHPEPTPEPEEEVVEFDDNDPIFEDVGEPDEQDGADIGNLDDGMDDEGNLWNDILGDIFG